MSLFHIGRDEKKLFKTKLEKNLEKLLEKIELLKGDFDIEKIYETICDGLKDAGVSSFIAIYDLHKNTITIKKYSSPERYGDIMSKIVNEGLERKTIPLPTLKFYKEAFLREAPFFYKNRSEDLINRYPQFKEKISGVSAFSSIIVPLILRGEIIGVLEIFSEYLDSSLLKNFEVFAKSLTKSIANSVLFQEIKKSEEKYWNLFANAREGFLIFDSSGKRIIEANEEMVRISGYTKDELKPIHYQNLFSPSERKRIEEKMIFLTSAVNGQDYQREIVATRILTRDQNLKSINLIINPTMKANEWFVIISDVSESKKLEEKIRSSKEHYEQIIDAIPDSLCVVDAYWKIISCNKAFADNLNQPIEKTIGEEFKKIIRGYQAHLFADFDCFNCADSDSLIAKALRQQKKYERECTIFDKFNQAHFFQLTAFPKKGTKEDDRQMILIVYDITEKKLAEEKVRHLDALNQRILDASPISIVMLDKDGFVITANRQARRLMDEPDLPIVGRQLLSTKEIATVPDLQEFYRRLFSRNEAFYYDDLPYKIEVINEIRHFNIVAVPLLNEKRETEGAISMAIDNTEAVVARQNLEELNRNLEIKVQERTKQLAAINEQLAKILDLKSKFISDASHELRTPLTVIQGNLDLAIQEKANSRQKIPEAYNLIAKEVEHMAGILTDLTLLTNADADTEKMNYEKIDLNLLVSAVVESLQIIARKKNIKLAAKTFPKPLFIKGDEAKLERAVLNLARNAIKYNKNDGIVKISTERDRDKIKIIIKDNGIGIPEKDLPYIFERFYRVDKARSHGEGGTGLGLAIAKWIAEAHGGEIIAKSKIGKGSTFVMYLPCKQKIILPGAKKDINS